ncbi:hypothetical protein ACFFJX_09325 [Pseudarcicella hirudinis]|uniref:phage major capsid protein n=1 Tax=Pseudarcicella hirudinis TaxID=1079859 RepID=UPI0035EB34A7
MNNTTYPLALQAYTDSETTISLDKFSSLPTTITDDQAMGASYNRIDSATNSHTEAILVKKFIKAAHAIAPAANTAATPVILVTGVGTEASGERLKASYEALVNLKAACDSANPKMPAEGRRLILCDDHWNDLLLDRKNFGDQLVNYTEGKPAPRILGFEIFRYAQNPYFNSSTKTKLAFGASPSAGQYQASFVFVVKNIGKKTGKTKQYYTPSELDAKNQVNTLAYRHYFLAVNMRVQHCAAILSINKA